VEENLRLDLLRQYEVSERRYQDLSGSVAGLIERILNEEAIQVHSITHRTKDRDSLDRKLARPNKQYSVLEEITDLSGIRVITYFGSDVDRVAGVVEREFAIDRDNSIDKRAALDPDRFGYLSLHYVASIAEGRTLLPEYARLSSLKFEIQVRSILQHSWAEIEHDLGYKSKAGVPREVQRRFARVAGLLELADGEFEAIRADLEAYAAAVPAAIEVSPGDVTIDKLSLASYIGTSPRVAKLDQVAASVLDAEVGEQSNTVLNYLALATQSLGIETIADLDEALEEFGPIAQKFFGALLRNIKQRLISRGYSLLYALDALAASRGDAVLREYLTSSGLAKDDEEIDALAYHMSHGYALATNASTASNEDHDASADAGYSD
jgi:putative GTP pyrophosphokinase